ncbi:phosphate ABC transporter permease subunit PstC [Richelia intracellularis]|uniref:phosphate ABC transporter permease subunit PstC n=1 Tax=Richelia intracellularis TaxID=1164990 RepID=UPI0005C6A6D4|nr:phosphate ABC transporter permease subunit PstC [Richelia intracellularis]
MSIQDQNIYTRIQRRSRLDKSLDDCFVWLTRFLAFAVAAVLFWIAAQVSIEAIPAIQKFGVRFLTDSSWNPVKNEYGVLPQIYGTLVSSLIALLIAVPVGLGTAILLSQNFLPYKVRTVMVFLVELIAAIPSVVYGIWGIFFLVPILTSWGRMLHSSLGWLPIFASAPSGLGMLPAGVILAIMILPIITAISRDALTSIPPSLHQAAVGLGATRWETILKVMLPTAFSGIVSAVILALGRAMGETMAVTMLIGNANKIDFSLFAPANSIASLLANQFSEAVGLQVSALMYAALVLFILTLIVNTVAELIVGQVKRI